MRILSRILTICLCSAPFISGGAHAVVATNAGHNLTAYNPSNSNNNQWATLTNVRDNSGQPTARADFGNCNAVVMRCATPKCANGGCVDSEVAAAIVAGCVQSNSVCEKYGDDLISYMSAQLVANSTAKLNAASAEAAAAAAAAQNAASEQTAQQIAQMQANMQSQMAQIQQQMAQQNAQTQQQLQDALAAQAEQNAAALQNITASTQNTISPAVQTMTVTQPQESAIERGISSEILVRQQITGQIMTEIENAEVSLKATKTAMQNSFDYAGCDARGNNCTGPKRVKKWRELASGFLEPYDNTIDKIYDALINAQNVGVDLSQIYAMLDDTCSSWSQYMCPGVGNGWYITYGYFKPGGEYVSDAPRVCYGEASVLESGWKSCRACTWLKPLTDGEEIYAGWLDVDKEAKDNQRVVACASSALETSKLFARRTKTKRGQGMVDIETLDTWLHQTEPSVSNDVNENMKYCFSNDKENDKKILQSSASSRTVPAKDAKFCVTDVVVGKLNKDLEKNDDCPYIAGTYAICDTHPYNAGIPKIDRTGVVGMTGTANISQSEEIREMVALKVTVISQQMYKQYEYLNATLRRLKTQLEKSVLTTTLEAAGAKSDGESSSSYGVGLVGGNKNSQYTDCSGKDLQGTIYCLRQNYSSLATQINSKKCDKVAKQQLKSDIKLINDLLKDKVSECDPASATDCKTCLGSYNAGLIKLEDENLDREAKRRGYREY